MKNTNNNLDTKKKEYFDYNYPQSLIDKMYNRHIEMELGKLRDVIEFNSNEDFRKNGLNQTITIDIVSYEEFYNNLYYSATLHIK